MRASAQRPRKFHGSILAIYHLPDDKEHELSGLQCIHTPPITFILTAKMGFFWQPPLSMDLLEPGDKMRALLMPRKALPPERASAKEMTIARKYSSAHDFDYHIHRRSLSPPYRHLSH